MKECCTWKHGLPISEGQILIKGMFLTKECCTWKHGLPSRGGGILIKGMFLIKRMLYLKAWPAKGGAENFDKRNVYEKKCCTWTWIIESMGCQEGGENFAKSNVVLEPESLKAWVAKTLKPKSLNMQPKTLNHKTVEPWNSVKTWLRSGRVTADPWYG